MTTRLSLRYFLYASTTPIVVGSVHYISPLAKELKEEPNCLVKSFETREIETVLQWWY